MLIRKFLSEQKPSARPGRKTKQSGSAADDAKKLRERGYALSQIQQFLTETHGIQITVAALSQFFRRSK